MIDMPIKFFQKDVISGNAEKPGDVFVAFFLNGNHEFVVEEVSNGCIMATIK